jgi:short-subunit dehydrogenase
VSRQDAQNGARLDGAFALVTGGSGGIGQAIAVALARAGVRVLLVARDAERLEEALKGLPGPGPHALEALDLEEPTSIERLRQKVAAFASGRLRVLVHAAGRHAASSIDDESAATLDAMLAANLRVPYLLTAALLPSLRAARGDVVFVNSSVVSFPRADAAAYAASKAGLRAYADCLRAAVNGDGVRVLSVFPGRTATSMQRERFEREGQTYRPELLLQPEEVAQAVLASVSLGETAELTELHLRPRLKS